MCNTKYYAYAGGNASFISNIATSISNVASAGGDIIKAISAIIQNNKEPDTKTMIELFDTVQDRAIKAYELYKECKITEYELEEILENINYTSDLLRSRIEKNKTKISNNTIHYTVDRGATTKEDAVKVTNVIVVKKESKTTPEQTDKQPNGALTNGKQDKSKQTRTTQISNIVTINNE